MNLLACPVTMLDPSAERRLGQPARAE